MKNKLIKKVSAKLKNDDRTKKLKSLIKGMMKTGQGPSGLLQQAYQKVPTANWFDKTMNVLDIAMLPAYLAGGRIGKALKGPAATNIARTANPAAKALVSGPAIPTRQLTKIKAAPTGLVSAAPSGMASAGRRLVSNRALSGMPKLSAKMECVFQLAFKNALEKIGIYDPFDPKVLARQKARQAAQAATSLPATSTQIVPPAQLAAARTAVTPGAAPSKLQQVYNQFKGAPVAKPAADPAAQAIMKRLTTKVPAPAAVTRTVAPGAVSRALETIARRGEQGAALIGGKTEAVAKGLTSGAKKILGLIRRVKG